MHDFLQDLRYGARSLAGAPAVTLSALISLALGIAVNCVVFSVVYGTVLQPLPYPEPERIVTVWERAEDPTARPQLAGLEGGRLPMSVPNFFDYREQNSVFAHITNYNVGDATVVPSGGHEPERIWSAGIFWGFFGTLGVEPEIGRSPTRGEEEPGNNKVLVISHGLWQRWFDGDPAAVGSTLGYEGEPHQIIGVMPEGFEFPRDVQIWHPAGFPRDIAPRNFNFVYSLARLAPGVGLEAAQAEMDAIAGRLAEAYPETNRGMGIELVPLHEFVVRDVERALVILWVAVSFVLLIACANVASLLLARATARRGEMAMRTALGASRGRLIRQLLVESLLLALAGGAAGLGLARLGLAALLPMVEGQIPRAREIELDGTVVLFTLGLTLVAGLLSGLVPALRASRTDITQTLKDGGERMLPGASAGAQRLRRVLVVVQVALATALVAGAGLLVRSFDRLLAVEPGFDAAGVVTFEITLPSQQYRERHQVAGFFYRLEERLAALPGVESVGSTWFLPMTGRNAGTALTIEGDPTARPGEAHVVNLQSVTPGFFDTLGVDLVAGRRFGPQDGPRGPGVVVINEEAARRYWPGRDPVSERVSFAATFGREAAVRADGWEVIGVVDDLRHFGLDQEVQPELYFLNSQSTWRWQAIAVRTAGNPAALVPAIRRQVAELDPALAIGQVKTLDEILRATVARPRFHTWLMALFSAVALVLAGVGIYGVVAYTVGLKTHEIAVRMTLGAERRAVMRMVVAEGVRLGLVGLVLGLGAAFAATRFLASQLFEVSATDPPTFVGVAVALAAVVLVASWLPARRATRLEPQAALRSG